MTDCPNEELRDLLPLLAHGVLDAADESRVRAHVAQCADCREDLVLLGSVRRRVDATAWALDITAIIAEVQRATVGRPAADGHPATDGHPAADAPVRGQLRVLRPARRTRWLSPRYAAAAAAVLLVASISLVAIARTFGTADDAADVPVLAMAGLSVEGGLSDLSDADLATLLDELNRVEATVIAEPTSLRQPIVDAPEGF